MPKYTFKCDTCEHTKTTYVNIDTLKIKCPACHREADRLPPNINKANVTELVDPYSGVNLSPEFQQEMSQRSLDYFWAVEVPRLCGEYPQAECISNGWAYFDEKGQFCIYSKPPNRR